MSYQTYYKVENNNFRETIMKKSFDVEFYEKENGEVPVKSFLLSLNDKMLAKIFRIIDVLQDYGPKVRMPHSKALGDGLFEIRAKQGSDISRVLYFFYIGKKVILTNGFVKKTQKTPKGEIELAKKFREDYLKRYKND